MEGSWKLPNTLNTVRKVRFRIMSKSIYRRTIIYKAENKVDGMVYIGKTIQPLQKRKLKHQNGAIHRTTIFLHRALRKYGFENFSWEILDETFNEQYALKVLEPHYIQKFKSNDPRFGYNMTSGGEGVSGFTHSEKTKQKIRKGNRGKHRSTKTKARISKARTGTKHSEETKQKMSKTKTNRQRKPFSVEHKRKIAMARTGTKHSEETKQKISRALEKRNQSKHL